MRVLRRVKQRSGCLTLRRVKQRSGSPYLRSESWSSVYCLLFTIFSKTWRQGVCVWKHCHRAGDVNKIESRDRYHQSKLNDVPNGFVILYYGVRLILCSVLIVFPNPSKPWLLILFIQSYTHAFHLYLTWYIISTIPTHFCGEFRFEKRPHHIEENKSISD